MHATVKFISAYTQICILASEHVRTYFVHAYIYTGSIYSYMRGVIKKYGECLNKKNITVKGTLPLIPLKILLSPSNTLIPSFFLKQFWKSSFMNVFSFAVVVASMS